MKKRTQKGLLATPCPKLSVKRPMSQRTLRSLKNQTTVTAITLVILIFTLTSSLVTKAQAQAQNQTTYTIKGTVTDDQNNPLSGAIITNTKTGQSTQTTAKGTFTLSTSTPSGTISTQYLGYQSRTITYNTAQPPLLIALTSDPTTLRETEINAGYYTTSQKQSTGSISQIKAEQIEKQPVANPLSALQGRVTGAYIQQTSGTPGGNISIQIRGQNSIETSSNPLYIVDGIPYNSTPQFNNLTATVSIYTSAGPSPLNALSPEEIQSIEILKDADATAIYGTRGANGVVLITTKRHKNGSPTIQLSTQSGISHAPQRISMLNTTDYLALRKKAIELDNTAIKPTDYDLNGTWDPNAQTNWQQELFGQTATYSSTRIALGGGSENHSFGASASYNAQGSVYQGNNRYNRTSMHLTSSHHSNDQKFKANFSVLYSADATNWLNSDYVSRGVGLSPNAPILRNPDGSLNWASSSWINPLRNLENKYHSTNENLTSSLRIGYSPIKDLNLSATMGYGFQRLENRTTLPVSYYDPAEGRTPATSQLDLGHSQISNWNLEPQASYHKRLGKHHFSILLGTSFQQQQRSQELWRVVGFASDALMENIDAATTVSVRGNSASTYRYSGTYSRLNYSYQDKLILNLTARRDASSRFGPGRTSANFGAIGAAYLISEEAWIKQNLKALSFLKFRASYGLTGSDQIGDYEFLDTYQSGTGYNGVPALSALRLLNPDFGWEKNRKLELGLDFGLFADQLSGTIGYYRNRSSSQLVDYPLALTTGFSSIRNNLDAQIQNTGIEIELNARPKQKGKLKMAFSANLTIPRNKLLSFPGLEGSSYASSYVIGKPLNLQKLYGLKGVNPQTGLYEFIDQNGDGAINAADRTVIKKRGQSLYGGIGTIISYQNLDLDLLIQVVTQRMGTFRSQYSTMPGRLAGQPIAYQGKYWLAPGDIAELQRPSTGLNTAANTAQSNYALSEAINGDASFARLKNLSLSYRTTKLIPGKTLKLGIQGQNLYTLTRYFGLDPESANLTLPPLRTIALSLNLNF